MPSFANPTPVTGTTNPLIGLWKDQSTPSALDDLLTYHRTRAAEILSVGIPSKITHIRSLIASESDPSSLLWSGHVNEKDFINVRMIQPDHLSKLLANSDAKGLKKEDMREGEGIILPGQVTRATAELEMSLADEDEGAGGMMSGLSLGKANGHMNGNGHVVEGENIEKGVRVGPHWFEVVPRNKAQSDLVGLTTQEHEDLHSMIQDLRVWLELEIPLIEDGNSFGAEVQNHLIKELELAYKKSNGFINSSRQHHTDRIRLVTEWIKYPNVMDYPSAIETSDRFDNFISRSYLRSLLMIYGGLLMRFKKNWEKVINPKGTGNGAGGGIY